MRLGGMLGGDVGAGGVAVAPGPAVAPGSAGVAARSAGAAARSAGVPSGAAGAASSWTGAPSGAADVPTGPASPGVPLGPGLGTPAVLGAYVDAVAALARSRAAADALEAAVLADLVVLSGASGVSSDSDLGLRSVAAEVGAVIGVSDRTVQRRMADAYQLVRGFPAVHEALCRGEISLAHAQVIVSAGLPVPAGAVRERFVERALGLARTESPNRLRAMLGRVAEQVRETDITERHREAAKARAVWVTDDCDGMSTLHAYLPSVLAHGVKDRLDQIAHTIRRTRDPRPATTAGAAVDAHDVDAGAGASTGARGGADVSAGAVGDVSPRGHGHVGSADVRSVDQVRADVLADMLLCSVPTGVDTATGSLRATVAITVPVLTLLGTTEAGAELDGAIPIDADTARELAGNAPGWDRVLTDPISGAVLATDRYRPTAEMKRFLSHRYPHCSHPGCRVPVRHTDMDHNHDWARGGKTTIANLAPLCRRHHTLKTSAGWRINPLPGGDLEFITPLGRSHLQPPPTHPVAFTPSTHHDSARDDPPPPW